MKKVNVAVVGVGAVGIEMLKVLKRRNFPLAGLKVFARSSRKIKVDNDAYQVEEISSSGFKGIDIALFAGTEGEKGAAVLYAPEAIKQGAVVIDNGADFRLKDNVPLVVPEVNKEKISSHKGLIANPNCTTIQMVTALAQIHKQFGLGQIILTSFQATSGAGKKASAALAKETEEIIKRNTGRDIDNWDKKIDSDFSALGRQIAFNVIAKIGSFGSEGYTSEEKKVVNETHKIFGDNTIKITATCVRVPVHRSHSEAVYFTTRRDSSLEKIANALSNSEGVIFYKEQNSFPQPLVCEGKEEVFVGRLRQDPANKNSYWLFCVSDNLLKGAALNAVQIAECLLL